jgi:hypothetical protein
LRRHWDGGAIRAYASGHTWSGVAHRVFTEWQKVRGEVPSASGVRDIAESAPSAGEEGRVTDRVELVKR